MMYDDVYELYDYVCFFLFFLLFISQPHDLL